MFDSELRGYLRSSKLEQIGNFFFAKDNTKTPPNLRIA